MDIIIILAAMNITVIPAVRKLDVLMCNEDKYVYQWVLYTEWYTHCDQYLL